MGPSLVDGFERAFADCGIEQPAFVRNRRRPSREWLARRHELRLRCAGMPRSREEWVRDCYVPLAGGASSVTVTLDTTAPGGVTLGLVGNAGAEATFTNVRAITANVGTTDGVTTGYQMLIWGSVDTTVNANIQATQGASAFIAYNAAQAVTLSTGDGAKTLNVIVMDDVGNQSGTITSSITLDTTVPIVTVQVGSPTAAKISKVAGHNTSQIVWQSDSIYQAYELEVVASTGAARGSGTVIGTTNGSTNMSASGLNNAASTNLTSTVNGADLQAASAADGAKIIKVFVQDVAGNWSS